MTREEKQLLLVDLCGRLPYGVILSVGVFDNGDMKYHNKKLDCHSNLLSLIELDGGYYFNGLLCRYPKFSARPYLRPMDSMTDEEKEELLTIIAGKDGMKYFQVMPDGSIEGKDPHHQDIRNFNLHWINFDAVNSTTYNDWLNRKMFDYRGLIPMGLALEAKEEMY